MNKTVDDILRDVANKNIDTIEANLQMRRIITSLIDSNGPFCKICGDYGIINVGETDMYKSCECTQR
jgi:hypothetical protein